MNITQQDYKNKINLLKKYLNISHLGLNFLENYDDIINLINEKYKTDASKMSYFIACVSTCKNNNIDHKPYQKEMMKNRRKIDYINGLNLKKEDDINYNEIFDNTSDDILLNLIKYLPPRRAQDYKLLKVKYGYDIPNDDFNYFMYDLNLLVYNRYKTSKYYGQQIINLNNIDDNILKYSKIRDILKNYCSGLEDEKFIIKNRYIGEQLKKYGYTLTQLRHSYINYIYENNFNYHNLKLISGYMGHNINTQLIYRRFK